MSPHLVRQQVARHAPKGMARSVQLPQQHAKRIKAGLLESVLVRGGVKQTLLGLAVGWGELRMGDEDGVVDNSRRLWNVLVFMVWHGIFVEQSIVPLIEDHTYPVRL